MTVMMMRSVLPAARARLARVSSDGSRRVTHGTDLVMQGERDYPSHDDGLRLVEAALAGHQTRRSVVSGLNHYFMRQGRDHRQVYEADHVERAVIESSRRGVRVRRIDAGSTGSTGFKPGSAGSAEFGRFGRFTFRIHMTTPDFTCT